MRIDAHHHFWSIARGDYGWLTPELEPLYRDFLPADLQPLIRDAGIDGTILVQAAPTIAETEFMLSLADETPFVKGVIGWVDFEHPHAPDHIARLAAHPTLAGLRPMIQDIPDPDWILRDALTPAFEALIAHDLAFDALTLPHHLPNLLRLLHRHPDLRAVIDHGSKPLIRDLLVDDWARDITALANETKVMCKFSGLVTEAAPGWTVDHLKPFSDHLLASFGAERLMWGSDWPVCVLASSYHRWVEATDILLGDLDDRSRAAILGGNAIRFYRLSE